jgi:hypothetical protein
MAELHKMSPTAGATSEEYVAINRLAVSAVAAGVVSALIFIISSWVMLVIPAIGLILGIAGLVQIRRSGGTQAGVWIAAGGIALCVCLGGLRVGLEIRDQIRNRPAEEAIRRQVHEIGREIVAGEYEKAYAQLHPQLQEKLKYDAFVARCNAYKSRQWALVGLESGDLFDFDYNDQGQVVQLMVNAQYENAAHQRQESASGMVFQETEKGSFQILEWEMFRKLNAQ